MPADSIKQAILQGDLNHLKSLLKDASALANSEIRWGENLKNASVPLHFLADVFFEHDFDMPILLEMARLLIAAGADLEKTSSTGNDTPLIAAASLHADELGILLIESGCKPATKGTFGGTAFHWAAWTGGLELMKILLQKDFHLEQKCDEFNASVLFWAVHGYVQAFLKNEFAKGRRQQFEIAKLLVDRGADVQSCNAWNETMLDLFTKSDEPMYRWLESLGATRKLTFKSP